MAFVVVVKQQNDAIEEFVGAFHTKIKADEAVELMQAEDGLLRTFEIHELFRPAEMATRFKLEREAILKSSRWHDTI